MFCNQKLGLEKSWGACTAATPRACMILNEHVEGKLLKIGPNLHKQPDQS
jgi:hypothetical protein